MPSPPPTTPENESRAALNERLRDALNDSYAALEGQRNLESMSAFTFEDAADVLIEQISGGDTLNRPNELHRVERINGALQKAVKEILALPANAFTEPSKTADVNTPPDDYDPDEEESTTVKELFA